MRESWQDRSRAYPEFALLDTDRLKRWTCHGSKKYLWKVEDFEATIPYVIHEKGDLLAAFENINCTSFAEAVTAP